MQNNNKTNWARKDVFKYVPFQKSFRIGKFRSSNTKEGFVRLVSSVRNDKSNKKSKNEINFEKDKAENDVQCKMSLNGGLCFKMLLRVKQMIPKQKTVFFNFYDIVFRGVLENLIQMEITQIFYRLRYLMFIF